MKQNEVIFQVGTLVVVKSDYTDGLEYRKTKGIVLKHETNEGLDGDFVDNYIKFETGEIEPFANWEIQCAL